MSDEYFKGRKDPKPNEILSAINAANLISAAESLEEFCLKKKFGGYAVYRASECDASEVVLLDYGGKPRWRYPDWSSAAEDGWQLD